MNSNNRIELTFFFSLLSILNIPVYFVGFLFVWTTFPPVEASVGKILPLPARAVRVQARALPLAVGMFLPRTESWVRDAKKRGHLRIPCDGGGGLHRDRGIQRPRCPQWLSHEAVTCGSCCALLIDWFCDLFGCFPSFFLVKLVRIGFCHPELTQTDITSSVCKGSKMGANFGV